MPTLDGHQFELKKLQHANLLARSILEKRSTRESDRNEDHAKRTIAPNMNTATGRTDIWGAEKYLNDANYDFEYARQTLKSSREVLRKSHTLLQVTQACSYEVVESTDELLNGAVAHKDANVTDDELTICIGGNKDSSNVDPVTYRYDTVGDERTNIFENGYMIPPVDLSRNINRSWGCQKDPFREDLASEPQRFSSLSLIDDCEREPELLGHLEDIKPSENSSLTVREDVIKVNTGTFNIDNDENATSLLHLLDESEEFIPPDSKHSLMAKGAAVEFDDSDDETNTSEASDCFSFTDKSMDTMNAKPNVQQDECQTLNHLCDASLNGEASMLRNKELEIDAIMTHHTPSEEYGTRPINHEPQQALLHKTNQSEILQKYTAVSKSSQSHELVKEKTVNVPKLRSNERKSVQDVSSNHVKLEKAFPLIPKKPMPIRTVQKSLWDTLPNEIVLLIFSHLSQCDLKQISLVCSRFYTIAKDHCLWSTINVKDSEITSKWLGSFTRVKQLTLTRAKAKQLSNKDLRVFFQNSKDTLKVVHVSQCPDKYLFGDNILLHIATHCRKVQHVSLPWSNTSDNGVEALAVSNLILTDLDISGNCYVNDESIQCLLRKSGRFLKSLKISGCFALTNDSLTAISHHCQEISILEIGLCPKMGQENIIAMCTSLNDLRELDLRGLKPVDDYCLNCVAKNCRVLKKLVVANCKSISNNGISNLACELPDLSHLDISGCSKITDDGCVGLTSGLKNPACLDLSSTSVSYLSVLMLTESFYHSLGSLKLSFCNNITQDCLEKLVSFSFKLKTLHIHGCKRIDVKKLQNNRNGLRINE